MEWRLGNIQVLPKKSQLAHCCKYNNWLEFKSVGIA